MHILFFTYDVPYPPNSGGKTRAFNLLKYGKHDATISLFSFTREGYDLSNLEELKKMGIKTIELFPRRSKRSPRNIQSLISKKHSIFHTLYFDKKIKQTLLSYIRDENVDLVHFESFYTGFYLSEEIKRMGVKQVYGSENIEYKLYEEGLPSVNPIIRPLMKRETAKIKDEEIEMANISDSVLAVTEDEVTYFKNHSKSPSHVIANGVSIEDFPRIPEKKHEKLRLLFIGNFTYFPNRDAITYFMKHIWSKLSKHDYHLTVVGKNSSTLPVLSDLAIEKVEYVPDIYDAYAGSDVFLSPMRYGGGTNFKVLEAMAAGLPVVALSEKIHSINAQDGKELCVAQNDTEFVGHLKELRENEALRKSLGKNARDLVIKEYAWDIIGNKVYNVWQKLVDEKN